MNINHKTIPAALMLLLASVAPGHASDLDDCRSKEQLTNEVRLKACNAVIDGKQATGDDLAFAYYRRGTVSSANPKADQNQVMADISKSIELNPKLMEAYAFRALAFNRAMQYDKAIADLTKALEIAPDRWGLYSLRAMVYAQKKDNKDAIADFRSALDHSPPASSADMIRQRITKLEQGTSQ